MIKVFLDTDVILDLFLNREPFLTDVRMVFQLARTGELALFTSITSFTNSYYILSKIIPNVKAKEKLIFLEKRIVLLGTGQKIIKQALYSKFKDFEDAVQHYTALENKMELLLTRNIKDYKNAIIPVATPDRFLKTRNFYG